jgi:ribosome-associated protein
MDIRKLQRAIVDGLEDVKALDIQVFNTEHLSPLFERVIVASGQSNRQTKALAASVRDAVKSRGMSVLRTEGEDNGEWIIVDCGAAVAHIMQPSIREYYRLEEIWGGKPVKIKLGAATGGGLVKASEPMDDDEDADVDAAPARKAAAKSVAAKPAKAMKQPVGTGGPRKSTSTAAPAKKAVKATGARTATAKSAGGKAAGAKTSGARTSGAKAPAGRAGSAYAPTRSGASGRSTSPTRGTSGARSGGAKTAAASSRTGSARPAGKSAAPARSGSMKKIVAPVKGARSAAAAKPAGKPAAKRPAAKKAAAPARKGTSKRG